MSRTVSEEQTLAQIVPEFTRSSFDEDDWLSHCEDYRVECQGERIGTVEYVRFESRIDRPDELIVRSGLLRRRFVVPAEDVVVIVPEESRVRVRSRPLAISRQARQLRKEHEDGEKQR